jgi:FtsP/CotA-like multicopper oxidase with cupredoxin domain
VSIEQIDNIEAGDLDEGSAPFRSRLFSRRGFLISGAGGVIALAAGTTYVARADVGSPPRRGKTPPGARTDVIHDPSVKQIQLAVSDGWASMPLDLPPIAPYFPDTLAPAPFTTYIFGFRNVTGLEREQVEGQAGKAQICAPIIECTVGDELWVNLSNLALLTRPDLVDSHTVHWHGFRDAIPFYDGVPETSISVPIGRDFTYVYRPKAPGTYMYHCHFEDVEHVTMGMTGIVFVRPNGDRWRAYDVDPTGPDTAFDREYAMMLTEFDLSGHWNDAHIQTTDWTGYRPNAWLMNGRAWPDTIAPSTDAIADRQSNGDLPVPGLEHLQYQPISSRMMAKPGERVLIRLANLGFQEQTLMMPGVPLTTVGNDARPLTLAQSTVSDTITLGPGESRDLLLTAPDAGTYPFYNADPMKYRGTPTDQWVGGQRTELVVLENLETPQAGPNQWKVV